MVYFRKTLQMQRNVIIKPSQNDKITLLFSDIGKSRTNHEF